MKKMLIISTHDLTRRSTHISPQSIRILLFQLTTSRGGRLPSSPLLERMPDFNSRPHEEVDDADVLRVQLAQAFQLTTSRGGRRFFEKH